MNRRNFLSLFGAGVAGIAFEQAIPLGRVWSFPKEIVIPQLHVVTNPWGDLELGDVITIANRSYPFPVRTFTITNIVPETGLIKLGMEPTAEALRPSARKAS